MPKLSGQTITTPHDLAVEDHAYSDSLGYGDGDDIADTLRVPSAPQFSQRTGVGRILQFHGQAKSLFQRCFQVAFAPAKVWRKDQLVRSRVNPAWQADPDAFVSHPRMRRDQAPNPGSQLRNKFVGVAPRRD